jgi:hypothetical protein
VTDREVLLTGLAGDIRGEDQESDARREQKAKAFLGGFPTILHRSSNMLLSRNNGFCGMYHVLFTGQESSIRIKSPVFKKRCLYLGGCCGVLEKRLHSIFHRLTKTNLDVDDVLALRLCRRLRPRIGNFKHQNIRSANCCEIIHNGRYCPLFHHRAHGHPF